MRACVREPRRVAVALRARKDRSCVEFLDEAGEPRVVEPWLIGLIERGAVEEPGIALLEAVTDRLVSAGDREGVEHLVRDEVGHALPVALDRLPVERWRKIL